MLEFAHVARPAIVEERGLGLVVQAQAAQSQARSVFLEEVAGQQEDIAAALAQRRHAQGIDAEAMVEIGAEAPGTHFLGQVAVGGCDQAYVDAVLAIGADPLQLPALQHAEQLGLHRQRQLADLVEEQAAAVGQFELAAPFVDRAGEGAAHMAEQFAFHQGLGQRGAVETDHRLAAAHGMPVDGLRHQFLADPGLAGDQYAQVAVGDQADFFQQRLVRGALADHFPWPLASGFEIGLGALVLVLGAAGQVAHPLAGLDRGGGEAGEGLQGIQVGAGEARRIEGIQGQQAPGLVVEVQRTPQAIMDFQVAVEAFHQTVVGIGQAAVGGEAGRPAALQEGLEARMFADPEAPAEGVRAEAVHRQRDQVFAVQAQQRGGVAGQQVAQGLEQAAVAFVFRQVAGQVGNQRDQGGKQGVGGHFDLFAVLMTLNGCSHYDLCRPARPVNSGSLPWHAS